MAAPSPAAMARDDSPARVAALVGNHGPTLLRVARKVSLCADDAHDAFQRALEIYLRRLESIDPATEVAWMRVVVRNEALAVRKSRSRLLSGEEVDFDAQIDADQRTPEDKLESAQRVTRSAEALRHLKRDEAQALMLKAEGLSYGEIGEQLGWTYTKVNRCITEGRARFRQVFQGIESGAQCERFAPLVAALAAGEADAGDLVKLRPHLRHCGACRADVRRLHGSRWTPVAALFPLPGFLDRLRPGSLKAELYALLGRVGGADPVSSSVMAGGGRGMGVTALIGVCLAGAGAGGYCVAGGPLPGSDAPKESRVQRQPIRPAAVKTNAVSPSRPPAATSAAPAQRRAASTPPSPSPSRRSRADKGSSEAGSEFSIETPTPARTATAEPSAATAAAAAQPAAAAETENPGTPSSGGEFGFER